MSKIFKIAILAGDGIGCEVMNEALKILRSTECYLKDVDFQFEQLSVGANEYLRKGDPFPENSFRRCQESDAVLLGAMGLPNVCLPNGREINPQLDLRERLELYSGLRPVRLHHAKDSPLKNYDTGEIDILIVRENTEGLFSSRSVDYAVDAVEVCDTMRITKIGAERIIRAAFREAQKRRRHVTLVDKANVLPSMAYLRSIFYEISDDFPDVDTDCIYVDAAALYLVREPERFDVIVTENMFGDILSELAASLVGGMGMAPSADIGECAAVFQPAHGSAPDIAGKGIANPIAAILSVAMMLEWLGNEETIRGAEMIRRAIERVLGNPENRTPDMGGKLTTTGMGNCVVESISGEKICVR